MVGVLEQLAEINISGAPFLAAYGVTWIVCGVMWKTTSPITASLATLFQGMFALPIALLILYGIDAFENRPDTGELDELIIIIAMSQLLVLPLLIAMFKKKHYCLIPFVFSIAGAVHFLMYTWLYQTFSYLIMSLFIAFGLALIYYLDTKEDKGMTSSGASHACLFTGATLLIHAGYLTALHFLK
ncbi:hypothetical protein E2R51_14965 [Jeotgalibacillus sp. S-D1]|uniref:DUF7010 family protein n=1 Tax=Jeotgalibacillus sp. S-D1 TaxID=2552189 RepID=UPI0010599477|nr:hypothetical protein [Jeotgalibacillus sp. S-D1]TDL31092.1 hypothetical protein E2R51_14965 [Jeotgalibacillus sp. S-D1]